MALKDKIKNWENELKKVKEARREANEKFEKKEKELVKKIDEAKARLENENNKLVGDIVREMYGELTEENIQKFKALMMQTRKESPEKMETE